MQGETVEADWIRWYPEAVDDPRNEALREAVELFEPLGHDAGKASEEWLKERSLKEWPNTATWLLYTPGRVHGFFALRSSAFEFTMHDGSEVTVPCSQIEWLAKRKGGKFYGRSIIVGALTKARQVSRLQGNVALLIKPFDLDSSRALQKKNDYLRETDYDPQQAEYGHLLVPLIP